MSNEPKKSRPTSRYMSGQYVAKKAEDNSYVVTSETHDYGRHFRIYAPNGDSLTVPDRGLSPAEKRTIAWWFRRFLGIVFLLIVIGVIVL